MLAAINRSISSTVSLASTAVRYMAMASSSKIKPEAFTQLLKDKGLSFITGVPDSTLKEVCSSIECDADICTHVATANEGSAVVCTKCEYICHVRQWLLVTILHPESLVCKLDGGGDDRYGVYAEQRYWTCH